MPRIEGINTVGLPADVIQEHVFDCHREIEKLRAGLEAVCSLIDNSHGVSGLHLNGDIAAWGELRTGGRFESWLVDFDIAIDAA